jgi:rhodanese-related sulfurtransferase
MHAVESVSPIEYEQMRNAEPPPALIDVREPWEFAFAHLDEAELLPLGSIQEWAQTLDKNAAYVVVCHHGMRSEVACRMLVGMGFRHVLNLAGGIDAWSRNVDVRVPRYP